MASSLLRQSVTTSYCCQHCSLLSAPWCRSELIPPLLVVRYACEHVSLMICPADTLPFARPSLSSADSARTC